MLSPAQAEIVVDLIRKNARMLRRERCKPLRLINSLIWSREAHVPDRFLLPFSSSLSRIVEESRFDRSALPSAVGSLFMRNRRCGAENLAALKAFGAKILKEFGAATEDAVLTGDGAALAGLYQDPGALPAVDLEALLRDGTCANGNQPRELGPPADDWSEKIQFGSARWRKPRPALLITLFAAHVGDASNSPAPPVWPHLGLALLVWKDRVGIKEILDMGKKLKQPAEVERGLAIAAHIFPELAGWIGTQKLAIPRWERRLAIPLAARRIVAGERE